MFTQAMSVGEKVMNALGLTVLGMGVVFSVLIVLSLALDLLRVTVGNDNKKKVTPKQEVAKVEKSPVVSSTPQQEESEDEELVAVIAAAIASFSGTSMDNIIVRSIKPLPQKSTTWGTIGRQEQMLGRL